jgi:hypothetical protein
MLTIAGGVILGLIFFPVIDLLLGCLIIWLTGWDD